MREIFNRLGDEVARRWESRNFDPDRFADIATTSLAASQLCNDVSLEDVVRWFLTSRDLPSQQLRGFGQPPINVYNGRGFFIELLFWVNTPTSIHQHAFAGAFGVVHGSSLHSRYSFETTERICRELRLGELTLESTEDLERGDVRTIEPGDRFIHSLLHLESPSISVVVRTPFLPAYEPQYRYTRPGLATDPLYKIEPLETQLQLLAMLRRTRPSAHAELALELVSTRDLWYAFNVIKTVAAESIASPLFSKVMGILTQRHETFAKTLSAALHEDLRHRLIARHMRDVTNADGRYLLALLMNAPNGDAIRDLIERRFPGYGAEQKILDVLENLAATGRLGPQLSGLPVREPLAFAMRGASFADLGADLDIRKASSAEQSALLRKTWYAVNSVELLRPLLTPAGTTPLAAS